MEQANPEAYVSTKQRSSMKIFNQLTWKQKTEKKTLIKRNNGIKRKQNWSVVHELGEMRVRSNCTTLIHLESQVTLFYESQIIKQCWSTH